MVLFQVKYTPDGKLARRILARGVVTDYTYDNAGNLTRTEYNDNVVTPTITMSYDRVGNLTEATTAGVVTNLYAYDIGTRGSEINDTSIFAIIPSVKGT